jgi:hypothetical protein
MTRKRKIRFTIATVLISIALGGAACNPTPAHQPPGGPAAGIVPKGPGGV